jgi:hypothetical protein
MIHLKIKYLGLMNIYLETSKIRFISTKVEKISRKNYQKHINQILNTFLRFLQNKNMRFMQHECNLY